MPEDLTMNEDQPNIAAQSRGILRRVVGVVLLASVLASWSVWGLCGLSFYLLGMFNVSPLAYLPCFLPILIPVIAIYLPVLIVRAVSRRLGLTDRKWRRRMLSVIACRVFAASFLLAFVSSVAPANIWARGLGRYVKARADITGIQSWLDTLDPNDCPKYAPDVPTAHRPKDIPTPPSVGGLRRYGGQVWRDEAGCPMIRFRLGGGGFITHWGLVIGRRDLQTPPDILDHVGEVHVTLAPGVYIWQETH